jgi:hypothetical protein
MSFANRAAEDMTVPAQPDRVPYPILRRRGSRSLAPFRDVRRSFVAWFSKEILTRAEKQSRRLAAW